MGCSTAWAAGRSNVLSKTRRALSRSIATARLEPHARSSAAIVDWTLLGNESWSRRPGLNRRPIVYGTSIFKCLDTSLLAFYRIFLGAHPGDSGTTERRGATLASGLIHEWKSSSLWSA